MAGMPAQRFHRFPPYTTAAGRDSSSRGAILGRRSCCAPLGRGSRPFRFAAGKITGRRHSRHPAGPRHLDSALRWPSRRCLIAGHWMKRAGVESAPLSGHSCAGQCLRAVSGELRQVGGGRGGPLVSCGVGAVASFRPAGHRDDQIVAISTGGGRCERRRLDETVQGLVAVVATEDSLVNGVADRHASAATRSPGQVDLRRIIPVQGNGERDSLAGA